MEMISSVETSEVLSGPPKDLGRVAASNDEVAVVAEQSSHGSSVVVVVNAEDFRPVRRLGNLADVPPANSTPFILLSE